MSTAIATLPVNGDSSTWTEQEKALVEAAGLVSRGSLAPRPVVEAFLQHCRRSGLDPIARHIYCIERGGKWQTQVSIDGMRLVAQRSREYRGQTPTQWTADGVTWLDVWLASEPPAAARVGVHREGFAEPLMAVATWAEYAISNGQMWKKMPALMLSKTAEALALRKAFPQDLSGLYSSEEMDQAAPIAAAPVEARVETIAPAAELPLPDGSMVPRADYVEDLLERVAYGTSKAGLRTLYAEAGESGVLADVVDEAGATVGDLVKLRASDLPEVDGPVEETEDAVVVES